MHMRRACFLKMLTLMSDRTMLIGPGCAWFSIDGGAPVDLSSRPLLRKILSILVERRRTTGNGVVETGALLSHLWPAERVRSGLPNRLYNAVAQLRSLGLRDVLLRHGEGYVLNPYKDLRYSSHELSDGSRGHSRGPPT
jgi:hypothetical protein